MNKVILIGNLGKDPEVREIPSGKVCNFSVATTSKWKDKDGNKKEETEWHNVTCYGGTATIAGSYLRKGSKVAIEGKIRTRNYENKEGVKVYVTEVIADNLELLGSKQAATDESEPNF